MNREILFRGFHECSDGDTDIIANGEMKREKWKIGGYAYQYGYYSILLPACDNNGFDSYVVIPKTIGQFTGLTDKNGIKIFEGDIISTDILRPYLIVEYRDSSFMFNCNDGGKNYYDIMIPILDKSQTQYVYGEVIGNIYDNHELLKDFHNIIMKGGF